jgi:AcrR family transcriptional regulator
MKKNRSTDNQTVAITRETDDTGHVKEERKRPMSAARLPLAAQQTRSRKTWRALLDSGFSILDEQGLGGLTIPEVSRRAGVSVGTVYRRFGDKEGLLTALLQEFTTSFRDEIRSRMRREDIPADATPSDIVAVAVRAVVDTYRGHERLLRVFVTLGQSDPTTFDQGRRVSHEGRLFFREMIWPSRRFFAHPDAERGIDVAYRLVYAACTHRVVNGPNLESPTELSWDDLADELARTVSLLLFGKLPRGA